MIRSQLSLLKIPLMHIGKAVTVICIRKKCENTGKNCGRGEDCNVVLLPITKVNQLEVVAAMLHISEEQWNTQLEQHTVWRARYYMQTHRRQTRNWEDFSVQQIAKNYWRYCLENCAILSSNILCIIFYIGIMNYFTRVLNQQKYPVNFSALQWHRFTVWNSVPISETINIK